MTADEILTEQRRREADLQCEMTEQVISFCCQCVIAALRVGVL